MIKFDHKACLAFVYTGSDVRGQVMAADFKETPKSYKRKKSICFPESTIKIGKKCITINLNE